MKRPLFRVACWLAGFCLLVSCLMPVIAGIPAASAQDTLGVNYAAETGLSRQDPRVAAARIIQIALGFLGAIAVILVIYAGFLWMTSEGNIEKLKKAKDILRSAAIGLLIILSAFAIVTFVINKLNEALGNNQNQGVVDRGPDNLAGLGALGSGIIQSVYPAPGQTDVPRNTGIMVTFREKMKVSTICQGAGLFNEASSTCTNANVVTSSVRFFQTDAGDNAATNLASDKVKVSTTDGKTFVFAPTEYLGSASTNVWQSIKLASSIHKLNDQPAFTLGDFTWQFEVSTKVDLTPPQIQAGGIAPFPDNGQDVVGSLQEARPASSTLRVASMPEVIAAATVSAPVSNGQSGSARLEGSYNCSDSGIIHIVASGAATVKAEISGNIVGLMDSDTDISDGRVNLGCGLVLIKNGNIAPGNHGQLTAGEGWTITVTGAQSGNRLTVGNQTYHFVGTSSNDSDKIFIGSSPAATAANIIAKVNQTNGDVSAAAGTNNTINFQSRFAGTSSNSLILFTDNLASLPIISPFHGGQDRQQQITRTDLADAPRNSIIQINFSEAINPLTVVGTSDQVSTTIKVVNVSSTSEPIVRGKFVISNQYQTLEFIPNEECGTNACGDIIYCLPADSQLRVDVVAANLAPCTVLPNTCVDKTPYSQCVGGYCRQAVDDYYPLAALPLNSGLVDASFNSLDGNRNMKAVGPSAFYRENSNRANTNGDSYSWSFFINNTIDLTPPRLQSGSLSPVFNQTTSSLNQIIDFQFDKLMMASSLNSGEVVINNHNHRLINLFSAGLAPSYWISSQSVDAGIPDGYPDFTKVTIGHSLLSDATKYSVEIGSGIKDSRQNCFKPCQDNGSCASTNASCCNGSANNSATCN